MKKEENTEHTNLPALADVSRYAIMELDPADLRDVLDVNLGDGGIGLGDLETIKVGRGGSVRWDVPGVEEDERPKDVAGVIVYFRDTRAWWKAGIDEGGGNNPPECSSQDSIHGDGAFGAGSEGNPSGLCGKCPMAGWGSARNGTGRGQACRSARNLFLVPVDSIIPKIVRLPPTSIKTARSYFVNALIGGNLKYFEVETRISLDKSNKGGFDHATARFARPMPLNSEAKARFAALRAALSPVLATVVIKTEDQAENAE